MGVLCVQLLIVVVMVVVMVVRLVYLSSMYFLHPLSYSDCVSQRNTIFQ